MPGEVANHVPRISFDLDMDTFGKNLRSARKGAVGPSGMTTEHFRPLLENLQSLQFFSLMCEKLSQANVLPVVVEVIRVMALRKSDGGVRGIVAGLFRRRAGSQCIQIH